MMSDNLPLSEHIFEASRICGTFSFVGWGVNCIIIAHFAEKNFEKLITG